MQIFVGTSGFSYKEWKGTFYPEKLPQNQMLRYYSEQFSLVEMNNTFYRMPSTRTLAAWASQVPETFRFSLKAPQVITHRKRLKDAERETEWFLEVASELGGRLGPLLFQLPPNMKRDLPRLDEFLELLGGRLPVAFEFRHESWLTDDIVDRLRAHSCARCVVDSENLPLADLVDTAGWGYLRLRRETYSDASLRKWIAKIRAQRWGEAYVLFKHENTASGPRFAKRFLERAAS